MYRRVVLSSQVPTDGSANITVLYRVYGATPLAQYRRYKGKYNPSVSFGQWYFPVVFDNAVKIGMGSSLNNSISYEIVLDVDENQPGMESVEEITSQGVTITVYNADGVIVCHNNVDISARIDTPKTDSLGEMTTEPIDGPGEATSEPIDGTGEMASESIGGIGETM